MSLRAGYRLCERTIGKFTVALHGLRGNRFRLEQRLYIYLTVAAIGFTCNRRFPVCIYPGNGCLWFNLSRPRLDQSVTIGTFVVHLSRLICHNV